MKTLIYIIGENHADPAPKQAIQQLIQQCQALHLPVAIAWEASRGRAVSDRIESIVKKLDTLTALLRGMPGGVARFFVRPPGIEGIIVDPKRTQEFKEALTEHLNKQEKTPAWVEESYATVLNTLRSLPSLLEQKRLFSLIAAQHLPFFSIDQPSEKTHQDALERGGLEYCEPERMASMTTAIREDLGKYLPQGGVLITCTGLMHAARLAAHLAVSLDPALYTVHSCFIYSDYNNTYASPAGVKDLEERQERRRLNFDAPVLIEYYEKHPQPVFKALPTAARQLVSNEFVTHIGLLLSEIAASISTPVRALAAAQEPALLWQQRAPEEGMSSRVKRPKVEKEGPLGSRRMFGT